jgi:hypothetical protein
MLFISLAFLNLTILQILIAIYFTIFIKNKIDEELSDNFK